MKISYHNNDLIKSLEKAVYISKGTRFQRLEKIPLRILYSRFSELIFRWFGKTIKIKTKTFWGENMNIVIPEIVSFHIYRYGFFEEDLTKMILEYLKPGMIFIDIGTHFGYFTLLGLFLVGSKGQVHSFEPTPSTFKILNSNVLNYKNVVLNNLAVISKKTTISINDYGVKYSAHNSICNARLSQDIILKLKPKKYEIKTISIDEYVEKYDIKPDFIKIDAESAEYEILIGSERTINRLKPIISIEVGDYNVQGIPSSRELIEWLSGKGYRPYEYKEGKIVPHIIRESYESNNIIFLPL